ncbi:MAG: Hsp20/alpha crystallin family protein, partial [Patescibacteria group bacterium]|nr:Hsp20/alpha crystallin family protein [Patescibacteria group bacterium]
MSNPSEITKKAADQPEAAERTRSGQFFRPNCDIVEREDEIVVLADVPGACGERIDVKFEDGTLSIHAPVERRQPPETEYLLCEYGVGDYWRTFQVSEAVDASRISAECANGVLTLHLPKAEAAKPRKIAVACSGMHAVRACACVWQL